MTSRLLTLFANEMRIRSSGSAPFIAFGFFLLAGILAPFALGTDETLLQALAHGYLWLVAAIAVLVGLEGLFQEDLSTGRMEVLRLSGLPAWLIALVILVVYWMVVCLPLVIASVPVAWLLSGDAEASWRLAVSLLIGTPALAMLGGTLAAIAAVIRRGMGLVIFLALPFFAPALIFGTRYAAGGENTASAGLFLAAFTLQTVAICPLVAGMAIRQNME